MITRNRYISRRSRRAFANDFSALNPTIWANEAIVQLLPNMVVGNLINRDFGAAAARFGDIVNAYVPGTFEMKRKGALCENVVVQDASGSQIQVPLDQWPHVSFLICDGEEDRPALDLVETHLTPAVVALAQGFDRIVTAQVYQFLNNVSGHLNGVDETNVKSYVIETRKEMNLRNVPVAGRVLLLGPGTESEALEVEAFTDADRVGDQGQALREASLGRKYGFDIFMSQTQPEVSVGQTTIGTVTASAAGAGSTTVAIGGANAGDVLAGQWARIAGDDTPQHITDVTSGVITIAPGLKRAVVNGAAVTIVAPGAVNKVGGYNGTTANPKVIGWAKEILVDGFANNAPQLGQLVSFGTQTEHYAIIDLTIYDAAAGTFGFTLDRPLATAITNDMAVNLGPAGKYNLAFLRNALTAVVRPLAAPRAGTGALARTINDPINKLSIRVTITYDGEKQGHLVTLDFLMGVGILNDDLGQILLG